MALWLKFRLVGKRSCCFLPHLRFPRTRTAGWMCVCMQDQINSRIDLVLRMADEKWRLAQHAYDRLDVNIRRLDADLGRMEVRTAVGVR